MIKILKQKQKQLEDMLAAIEPRLKTPVRGRLEIVKRKYVTEYYKCSGPDREAARTRTYLGRDRLDEAKRLAQAAYDKKAKKLITGLIETADKFLKKWDEDALKSLYGQMTPERRDLIDPVDVDDETYVQEWQSKQYLPGRFDPGAPEIYTNKGERVRSKSEKIIADELYRLGIPYHYEYPFVFGGRTVRPDFFLLNVRTRQEFIMELFGMMDDPDYARKNVWKINTYEKQGYVPGKNLILLFETLDLPVDMKAFHVLINTCLK